MVDREYMNGAPSYSCSAGERRSCPLEVVIPSVHPWMKEPDDLARVGICSGNIRAFVPIAVKSSEGEIFKSSLTTVLTCNDVIDVKGQRIDGSVKVTILTSVLCTLPDFPDNVPIHE